MYDSVHSVEERPKLKVGIVTETQFLPVSASVKRAMGIARQALIDQGYEVVDVDITAEEYAEGRNLVIGMVATGSGPGMIRDFEKSGEQLTMGTWSNLFLMQRRGLSRFLINLLLKAIGMGRLATGT